MEPPDSPPPLKVLAWLKMWKFEEVDLKPGVQPWYRRNGQTMPWDEAPHALTSDLARQCDALTVENARLRAVTPKPGWLTSEFLLNVGGMAAVGVMASQGQIDALAETLGPQWGAAIKVLVAIIITGAGGAYLGKRKGDKAAAKLEKENITRTS